MFTAVVSSGKLGGKTIMKVIVYILLRDGALCFNAR